MLFYFDIMKAGQPLYEPQVSRKITFSHDMLFSACITDVSDTGIKQSPDTIFISRFYLERFRHSRCQKWDFVMLSPRLMTHVL